MVISIALLVFVLTIAPVVSVVSAVDNRIVKSTTLRAGHPTQYRSFKTSYSTCFDTDTEQKCIPYGPYILFYLSNTNRAKTVINGKKTYYLNRDIAVIIYNSSGTAKMDTVYAGWGGSAANADIVALVDPVLFTPVRSYHDAGFTTSTGGVPGDCGGWHIVYYN